MGKFLEDKFSFRKLSVTIWYTLLKSLRYGLPFVPTWAVRLRGWHASVGGGVVCLHGWHGWYISVDKVGSVLAWVVH